MADWTIPGNHVVTKDHGAGLDISSSHHDFKTGLYRATLEMRDGAGNWLGPKVFVQSDSTGATITAFDGTVTSYPAITFDHAGVQGLLDKVKVVTFVSSRVPDPRPVP